MCSAANVCVCLCKAGKQRNIAPPPLLRKDGDGGGGPSVTGGWSHADEEAGEEEKESVDLSLPVLTRFLC